MEAVEAFALVAGHVDEELLLRNEYLAAENEILRSKWSDRPQLTDSERIRLAKLGKRLGLKALKDVAAIVKPETVLAWYRKLVSKKFDGSAERGKSGMSVSDRPIRGRRAPANPERVRRALSRGEESPGQGSRAAIPFGGATGAVQGRRHRVQAAPRRASEVLLPGRGLTGSG